MSRPTNPDPTHADDGNTWFPVLVATDGDGRYWFAAESKSLGLQEQISETACVDTNGDEADAYVWWRAYDAMRKRGSSVKEPNHV